MSFFKFGIIGAIQIGLLCACGSVSPGPKTSVEVEGFQPFPSIRSFDKPGRIYRIDPEKKIFKVALLDVEPQIGEEILPKVSAKSRLSLGQVLETIGVGASEIPASMQASLTDSREFFTESVDGKREFIDDLQVDAALKEVFQGLNIRKDNKYYLIRETILSNRVNYRSAKSWLVSAGIEGEFERVVRAKATLNWEDQEEFSLNKTFDQPLRIWYKAERLDIEQPLGVGPGQPVMVRTEKADPDEFTITDEVPTVP